MAEPISLITLSSLANQTTAINQLNQNFSSINTALNDVLSVLGRSPNQMGSSLDMNSHQIINLPTPTSGQNPLRLQDYNTLLSGGTISVNQGMGIEFICSQGGTSLLTGVQGWLQVPFNCTITSVSLVGDVTGSVVVDIWKEPFASLPSTVSNSITASAQPTITSGITYTSSTLTGWTVTINSGDVLTYNLNSVSGFTKLLISLAVTKT